MRPLPARQPDRRRRVYVTIAVKHFKWRPGGKVRLHQKPNAREIGACRQWWERELEVVDPRLRRPPGRGRAPGSRRVTERGPRD